MQVRSCQESLGKEHTSNESSVKVRFRASLVDSDKFHKLQRHLDIVLVCQVTDNPSTRFRFPVSNPVTIAGIAGDLQRAL